MRARFDGDEVKTMMARKLAIMTDLAQRGQKVDLSYLNAAQDFERGRVSELRRAIGDPNQLLPLLVMAGVVRAAGSPSSDPSDAHTPPAR